MRGVLAKALHRVANAIAPASGSWQRVDGREGLRYIGGVRSASGQIVNPNSALCLSAVWACTKRTAEMIGSLPGQLYETGRDGVQRPVDDDLAYILGVKPNRNQTAMEFWEGQTAQQLLNGNAYAEMLTIGGRLVGLVPLHNVTPKWDRAERVWTYEVDDRGTREIMPAEKVFHLRGFGPGDGMGLSAVKYGAQSIGSMLAADEAAGAIFKNGLIGSGAIESDQTLTAEQRAQLQTLLDTYTGSSRAGKILPLEAGFKFKNLQIDPEDAQLLETRRFGVEDVCRWFGVPPIVIGHAAEGQTMWGSGVEQVLIAWRTFGLNPMLRRAEQRIACDLIPARVRGRWKWKWNREAILEMDATAKANFLMKMRMAGIMSGDEGRATLDMQPRGGAADELLVQTSLAPVDLLREEQAP